MPYGYTITGQIHWDKINHVKDKACDDFQERNNPFILDRVPIYLIERGNCTFVRKALNVQNAGGFGAIVIDNRDEGLNEVIMADDGNGNKVNIPIVLIQQS